MGHRWPQPQKNHAAMITRLDSDVGQVLDKLRELKLDDQTIVFFSSGVICGSPFCIARRYAGRSPIRCRYARTFG